MSKTIVVKEVTYRFQIWDTAGQERVSVVLIDIKEKSLNVLFLLLIVSIPASNVLQKCCSCYCCI